MDGNIYEQPSSELERNLVFCRDCGSQISRTASTCPSCGVAQQIGGKGKVAAGLLAIFLGGFGLHRFYLGQWWGLFYLLFCWTGIPGLIAFIEGIVFLCTSNEKWFDKYGNKKGGSALVLVLVLFFLIIPVIGILAAISIPAYQDYVTRAQQHQLESR
ncbi:NINE protein [Microbulbifer sp. JMSA004]|uniref:TM2 domain-containing protein n=1 Tax=unclassified Microbulbifer TaxID=2619833 RepID=UPI0024AE7FDD|nr:NINE protein [Microbulbifer sp. VAAF005]WHI46914.1 NINE protein [Microbulbifer sp. VAAF005]